MKKLIALILSLLIIIPTVSVIAKEDYTTLYAEDGRSASFKNSDVNAQLSVGWYREPVQRLYAEGKSKVFPKSQVNAQLTVGWYKEPVQRLYAEGKSKVFPKSQVNAQLTVGWYKEPVQRLYAEGKSKLFPKSQVNAQLTVGWSTTPVAKKEFPLTDKEMIFKAINKEIGDNKVLDVLEKSFVMHGYCTKEDAKKAKIEYEKILKKNSRKEDFENIDKAYTVKSFEISANTATVIVNRVGVTSTDSNIGYAEIDESTFYNVHRMKILDARNKYSFDIFSKMYLEAWTIAVRNDRLNFGKLAQTKYELKKTSSGWKIVGFKMI